MSSGLLGAKTHVTGSRFWLVQSSRQWRLWEATWLGQPLLSNGVFAGGKQEAKWNMGLSEEAEDNTLRRYEELCLDLNLDKSAKEEAWECFERISTNYTLEVGASCPFLGSHICFESPVEVIKWPRYFNSQHLSWSASLSVEDGSFTKI